MISSDSLLGSGKGIRSHENFGTPQGETGQPRLICKVAIKLVYDYKQHWLHTFKTSSI